MVIYSSLYIGRAMQALTFQLNHNSSIRSAISYFQFGRQNDSHGWIWNSDASSWRPNWCVQTHVVRKGTWSAALKRDFLLASITLPQVCPWFSQNRELGAKRKGTWSVALQVPFWATWVHTKCTNLRAAAATPSQLRQNRFLRNLIVQLQQ